MRIHELAKELDLKAKDIYPQLKKLGIEFKNHMSTISDDDVSRVKNLLNPPTAENIDEKRIKPTLIRRRRKKAEPEPPVEELKSAEEEQPETIPEDTQPVETVAKEPQEENSAVVRFQGPAPCTSPHSTNIA